MSNKNPFEVMAEMNKEDMTNKSKLLQISNRITGVQKASQGAIISFGVSDDVAHDVSIDGSRIAIVVVLDKEEYFKRMKQ